MKLSAALRLGDGEVVAFVGGGGKTTAMFRLAQEIVDAGGRVITTTTTRIFAAQVSLAPAHFSAFEVNRAQLEVALNEKGHVLVTGPVDTAAGKASSVTPDLVRSLRQIPNLTAVLVEADGSRMRPLKAPAEHEPVIPDGTTLVLPVVGADVFGQPLTDDHVHRAELVRVLSGATEGQAVTPQLVAHVVGHLQGGLKGVPPQARVVPLLNKVEWPPQMSDARETARRLLDNPRISGVAIGAVRRADADPVHEVWGRVAAVVLAAGRSTRMGRPKPTLLWGQGGTILGEIVRRLDGSGVSEIVVVTGGARSEVDSALTAAGASVRAVFNPDFESGEMALSLQVGLRSLPENCAAALVALGDQPQIQPAVAQAVIQRWRETQTEIVAPFFRGQRGHPLLFDRAVWDRLFDLPAGANPRDLVREAPHVEHVEVETDSILRDIDTPEDYARERSRTAPNGSLV